MSKWSLAFEVGIRQVAHTNHAALGVTRKWLSASEQSPPFKKHGHHADRVLEHIILDFAGESKFISSMALF